MLSLENLQSHVEQLSNSTLLYYLSIKPELYGVTIFFSVALGIIMTIGMPVSIYLCDTWSQRRKRLPLLAIPGCLLSYCYFVFSPISLTSDKLTLFNELRVDSNGTVVNQGDYISRAMLKDQLIISSRKIDDLENLKTRLAAIGIHPSERQLIALSNSEYLQ